MNAITEPVPLLEPRGVALYRTLSHTHRAIIGGTDVDAIAAEVCAACVDHGHAAAASLWLADGPWLVMRAAAGSAASLFGGPGARLPREGAAAEAAGFQEALRGGRPQMRREGLGATARARSLRAQLTLPLSRGGATAGVLALHFTCQGGPDAELTALAADIAADLSFALDGLDRVRTLGLREQQLTGIVETAMDAIITVDVGQRVRVFNRAASEMFGLDAALAIGEPLARFIPPALAEHHAGHVARFARTGSTSRRMGALHTLSGRRADGTLFPIEASISKLGEGEHALMTAVVRDLSAAREAERAREAQVAAEAACRAKSDFISRMSHELRTPLNAVLGFAQLLEGDPRSPPTPRQREYLGQARRAGWHLLALIDDLLDVARIEAGQLRMAPSAVHVGDAAAATFEVLFGEAARVGVALVPPAGREAALHVHADAARLRQVLINLLSNGIKYNRPGGRVQLLAELVGGQVRLCVADDGLGMDDAQRAQLFEPFNRLGREHGGVPGTGLGLALTRELVGAMGGRIEVDSTPGIGTCVVVWLPAAPAPLLAPAAPDASDAAAAATGALHGSVLYIEDNAVNLLLVRQFLARWPGITLIEAETAAEGLAAAQAQRPDLVLLDLQLPDRSGLEVLRALRADPATRALPVVAVSADTLAETVHAAMAAGADAHWSKPLDFSAFERGLRDRLAAR